MNFLINPLRAMTSNTTSLPSRLRTGAFALLAGMTILAGCDSSGTVRDTDDAERGPAVSALANDLPLSQATRVQIESAVASHKNQTGEPGFLWHVASDLQTTLSAEQKAELLAAVPAPGDRAAKRRTRQGEGAQRGGRGMHRVPGQRGNLSQAIPDLTDEQRVQIQEIHDTHADEARALRQAHRDGSLTREELRSRHEALRSQIHDEMAEVLTDEQKAALEAKRESMKARAEEHRGVRQDRRADRQERMEETRAVAAEVLNLTDAQQQALASLRETQRAEAQALAEQMRSGSLDREAAREAFRRQHEAHWAARAEILTPEQREIVQIHRALSRRIFHHGRMQHEGPPKR